MNEWIGAPNRNLRIRYIKQLLSELPKPNQVILRYLMQFLIQVKDKSEVNKMGIPNLATVFGPNLLVPPEKSVLQMVQDTPVINGIINSLIQDFDVIFLVSRVIFIYIIYIEENSISFLSDSHSYLFLFHIYLSKRIYIRK